MVECSFAAPAAAVEPLADTSPEEQIWVRYSTPWTVERKQHASRLQLLPQYEP